MSTINSYLLAIGKFIKNYVQSLNQKGDFCIEIYKRPSKENVHYSSRAIAMDTSRISVDYNSSKKYKNVAITSIERNVQRHG